MRELLVIEDGTEYEEFAKLFLADRFRVRAAHSAEAAVRAATETEPDALLVDLRFDRASDDVLVGDVERTARERFAGDRARAVRWLKEQQGALVLGVLRDAGIDAPAVFVHDFPARRLENLRQLYGRVFAVDTFDAQAIRRAFEAAE